MLAFGLGQMKSREGGGISIGKRGAWDWEMGPLATKAALGSPRLIPAGMCRSPPLGWPWVPLPFTGEGARESETLHAGLLNNAEAVSFVCIIPASSLPPKRLTQAGSGSQLLTHPSLPFSLSPPPFHSCLYVSSLGVPVPAHLFGPICCPQGLPSQAQCSVTLLQPGRLVWGLLCPTWLLGNSLAGCFGVGPRFGGVMAGPWLLAQDTWRASMPAFYGNCSWSGPRSLEKYKRARPSQAGESHSLWICRPQGGDLFRKN